LLFCEVLLAFCAWTPVRPTTTSKAIAGKMTSAIAATYFLNHETTDMLSLPIRGMERRYSGFEEMTKQFNPCVKLVSGPHLAFKPIAYDALSRAE
jgi:hypothetical protein